MPRARTRRVADPVQTRSSRTGGRRRRPVFPLAAGGALVLAVLWAGSFTAPGRLATAYVFVVLNYYIGAVTLVAFSLTVMAGLVSTDRILLRIGHRVLFQGIHRATAVLAMVALGIHVAVKVLAGHAALGDAVVPFFSEGRSFFIGFGTIAGYLMLVTFWAGLARTRFINSVRPWVWRLLHCSAYPCWLIALGHGLNAGRPAAAWVTVSYGACVVGVALALLVRLYTKFGRYSPSGKAERGAAVSAPASFAPRFQYAPAPAPPARVPVAVAPSSVDVAPARYEPAEPAGYADYDDVPARYEPDVGYWSDAPAEASQHDYWADGQWEQPDRPRLRLVADNENSSDLRRARTQPRGRRGVPAEDYRAG